MNWCKSFLIKASAKSKNRKYSIPQKDMHCLLWLMSIMTRFKAGFLNISHTLSVIGWINRKSRPKLTPLIEPVNCVILLFSFLLEIHRMCQKSHTLVGTTVDEEQTSQLRRFCVVWMWFRSTAFAMMAFTWPVASSYIALLPFSNPVSWPMWDSEVCFGYILQYLAQSSSSPGHFFTSFF